MIVCFPISFRPAIGLQVLMIYFIGRNMAMASAGYAPMQPVSSRQSSECLAYPSICLANVHIVEVSLSGKILLYRPPNSVK